MSERSEERKRQAREKEQARRGYVPDAERWNHNIHYHPDILRVVPPGATRVLDVGCGDGMLVRELAPRAEVVVGIDPDEPSITLARETTPATNVEYVLGDVLTHPFELASFDAIVSVAALHHMDTTAGLGRMADLLRPGGVLGVVGLARIRLPQDLPYDIAGAVATRALRLTHREWLQTAPMVWPPPDTYADVRRQATDLLPGCEYRRKVLFRYTLTWTKPELP